MAKYYQPTYRLIPFIVMLFKSRQGSWLLPLIAGFVFIEDARILGRICIEGLMVSTRFLPRIYQLRPRQKYSSLRFRRLRLVMLKGNR